MSWKPTAGQNIFSSPKRGVRDREGSEGGGGWGQFHHESDQSDEWGQYHHTDETTDPYEANPAAVTLGVGIGGAGSVVRAQPGVATGSLRSEAGGIATDALNALQGPWGNGARAREGGMLGAGPSLGQPRPAATAATAAAASNRQRGVHGSEVKVRDGSLRRVEGRATRWRDVAARSPTGGVAGMKHSVSESSMGHHMRHSASMTILEQMRRMSADNGDEIGRAHV